jgi:hypothetical protein
VARYLLVLLNKRMFTAAGEKAASCPRRAGTSVRASKWTANGPVYTQSNHHVQRAMSSARSREVCRSGLQKGFDSRLTVRGGGGRLGLLCLSHVG